MNDLERLLAIEEIKQTKARYYRAMDTKDWDLFAAQFSPNAVMDARSEVRSERGLAKGPAEIAAFIQSVVGHVTTVHHGHMPEIEITSPTTATAVFAMEDHLWWPEGHERRTLHGYGHYHEAFEKVDGRWLILTTSLSRLRVDEDPPR